MFENSDDNNLPVAFTTVLDRLDLLQIQLGERIQPLMESMRPIWSDPLWQFLGLVLVGVIVIVVVFWLLRLLGERLTALFIGIKNIMLYLIKKLWGLIFSSTKADDSAKKETARRTFWFNSMSVKKAFDSVRYLTTKRDWRYESSWYLMTGPAGSDKEAWLNSIQKHRRADLLFREKQLISADSGWHFFDSGLIIDVDEQADFDKAVELLTSYRPERPLDGIILAISADQLKEPDSDKDKDKVELRKLGQDLYRKMWSLQKTTGFVLPVYLIVTECEKVKGFSTFWSAWDEEPVNEMFGWSNKSKVDAAFSIQWVREAFSSILSGVRKAQLSIAANSGKINDIDSFMLFDYELQKIEAPLTEVIQEAFSRSSFQEALPLRGIWFSGRVNDEYALTEDLLTEKIWLEKNLSHPVEKRFFSVNKTLRHFQYATMVIAGLLMVMLTIDSYRMQRYTQTAEQVWNTIFLREEKRFYCSNEGIDTWWLLNSMTKLSDQPTTFAIPASWGGGQLPAIREASAQSVYPKILFPAYECRLRVRAKQLNALSQAHINDKQPLKKLREHLLQYSKALGDYQDAQARFVELVGPLTESAGVAKKIRHLTDYLYDGSIPSTIKFSADLLVGGVMDAHYDIEWEANDLIDTAEQSNYLVRLSRVVRKKITEKALNPPVDDIIAAFFIPATVTASQAIGSPASNNQAMLTSVDNFQHWLEYMSTHWLSYTPDNSPCYKIHQNLQVLQATLKASGYPEEPILRSVARFSPEGCENVIRGALEKINEPPFGNFFTKNEINKLTFSESLLQWVNEFSALEKLNLLTASNTYSSFDTESYPVGKIVGWDSAPLSEAIDIMLGYQKFHQHWWEENGYQRKEPFYASALRLRLEASIKQLILQARVFEYTKKPNKISAPENQEARLANSIASFERAEPSLRQLIALLKQEGDGANADLLQKQSRGFILQQLKYLTAVVNNNKLYTPIKSTNWDSANLAQALFSYSDTKSLSSYLENQRQRLNFLAQNYAKPLVSYLLDTDVVDESRNEARLWYNTLIELQEYARKQSQNDIAQLESYIEKDLLGQSWGSCEEILSGPTALSSGGLFSQRYYDISENVRYKCGIYSKNTIMRRYLALAQRFNRDLKGQFPFAKYSGHHRNDLRASILKRFMDDYQTLWANPEAGKPLIPALTAYLKKNPNTGLDNWLVFVKKLDKFANFYQKTSGKDGSLPLSLAIEFNARASSSQGQDQIIEWRLTSGHQSAVFPNGKTLVTWDNGDALSLTLRWANGSEYYPLSAYEHPEHINPLTFSARFNSDSHWSIFEWMQRFGDPRRSTTSQNWFLFSVPVGLKALREKNNETSQAPAYISRIHLAVSAVITEENGREKHIAIPFDLPRFAPSLPGRGK